MEYNRLRNLTGVVAKFRDGSWTATHKAVKYFYENKMDKPTVLPLWMKEVLRFEDDIIAVAINLIENKKVAVTSRQGRYLILLNYY